MKRSRPMYRRVLAVAGSAVIGLIGAVTLASPASAHHTEVTGDPYCDTATGEWVVTWTVNSFAPDSAPTYRLLDVEVTPDFPVSNIVENADETSVPYPSGTPLVGEQRLPGDAQSASLGVRAQWSNGFTEEELRTGEVTFKGTCEKPVDEVQVSDASNCDEILVTVINPEDGADVVIGINTSTGFEEEDELGPGEEWTISFAAGEGFTYEVTVDGEVIWNGAWEDPGDCQVVEIPVASRSDCESLTIEVTNPLEDEAIEATISDGEASETLTIEPGQTGEVTLDAEDGTVATVTIGDDSEEIAWEEPDGCDGSGGGLPVTGASTGVVVGAALALFALGGGLFLLARRRRITFTA